MLASDSLMFPYIFSTYLNDRVDVLKLSMNSHANLAISLLDLATFQTTLAPFFFFKQQIYLETFSNF